jgi:hypothetical protein
VQDQGDGYFFPSLIWIFLFKILYLRRPLAPLK